MKNTANSFEGGAPSPVLSTGDTTWGVLGPVQKRHGHAGASAARATTIIEGLGASVIREEGEKAGTWRKAGSRGILPMRTNISWEWGRVDKRHIQTLASGAL